MTKATPMLGALDAAGASDPGLARDVNEDRFYVDPTRGIFIVVDGVGGQAAGGKAADIALAALKAGLTRDAGTLEHRIREAITLANNEIYRTAATRSEWNGMACVLTAAVVEDGRAVIGHVGDTRLYKLRDGGIQKVTRDHSPVGEREDQGEISEVEAMNHPRRHEVYRDVGSDRHGALDNDFVDVYEIAFEPDAALILCSDGLTDLVDSLVLGQVVRELAGQPQMVVRRLIDAANAAGGKDNVTVVYVEGERFAEKPAPQGDPSEITRRRPSAAVEADQLRPAPEDRGRAASSKGASNVNVAVAGILAFLAGAGVVLTYPYWSAHIGGAVVLPPSTSASIVVRPTESIATALQRATSGSQVIVEPGEYRERLVLQSGVVVVSRVPHGATLRLPGGARDTDAAVVADGVSGAMLIGFRILGDVATPLGTGVLIRDSDIDVMDVEISGATSVAIDVRDRARVNLVGSTIQSVAGAALAATPGTALRVANNRFVRHDTSNRVVAPMVIPAGIDAKFGGNIFQGFGRGDFAGLSEPLRSRLAQQNLFVEQTDSRPNTDELPPNGRSR
jgi:PPM family protein phosphatase